LNTRTSEKNGDAAAPGGRDVTAGSVTVSPDTKAGRSTRKEKDSDTASRFTSTGYRG
jgi:hypothetical protein